MLELETAKRAAHAGGDVLTRYFRDGVAIHSKAACELVSQADIQSEQTIVSVIRETFPDHAVLGEEAHRAVDPQAENLWVIDPLDGTNNFAHRISHFAVSIAYYHGGEAVCGVVYNPITGDWYEATRGQGAMHNGAAVRVADHRRLDEVLIAVGFYYDRGAMMQATLAAIGDLFRQQIHGVRRFGTAALDLAYVGMGCYGAFFEYQLSPWDFAAGRLFVEEAGGRVTTCDGQPLPLAPTSILASNGPLHDAVLEIVRRHYRQNWI
jgi:myo-inositol-1(or 4)-monophosphatase